VCRQRHFSQGCSRAFSYLIKRFIRSAFVPPLLYFNYCSFSGIIHAFVHRSSFHWHFILQSLHNQRTVKYFAVFVFPFSVRAPSPPDPQSSLLTPPPSFASLRLAVVRTFCFVCPFRIGLFEMLYVTLLAPLSGGTTTVIPNLVTLFTVLPRATVDQHSNRSLLSTAPRQRPPDAEGEIVNGVLRMMEHANR